MYIFKTTFDGNGKENHGQKETIEYTEISKEQAREMLKRHGLTLKNARRMGGISWYSEERGNKTKYTISN